MTDGWVHLDIRRSEDDIPQLLLFFFLFFFAHGMNCLTPCAFLLLSFHADGSNWNIAFVMNDIVVPSFCVCAFASSRNFISLFNWHRYSSIAILRHNSFSKSERGKKLIGLRSAKISFFFVSFRLINFCCWRYWCNLLIAASACMGQLQALLLICKCHKNSLQFASHRQRMGKLFPFFCYSVAAATRLRHWMPTSARGYRKKRRNGSSARHWEKWASKS